MANLNPMDILNAPTNEEITLAEIVKWIKSSHDDKKNKVSTIVFKKDTPINVLNLFQKNTDLFSAITDFTINKHYEIEK